MAPRPLHHLVLPVTTLNLARGRLEGLGFTVAPDAAHPFGTGNCCVFFADGTYLEPLTIIDRDLADQAAAEGSIFVRRAKRFTERSGEGFAMLALRSENADKDQARFESAMISLGPVFRFERTARLADGSEVEVAFALAFAADPAAPDATFFTCRPTNAERLWDPDLTAHPNGVRGISAVTAVAADPSDFQDLLAAATGQRHVSVDESSVTAAVGSSEIRIVTPAAFLSRYGVAAPEPRRGLLFAAVDLVAGSLAEVARFVGSAGVRRDERIVLAPTPGLGAVLRFEETHA